jgi:hypothetical protein
LIIHADPPRLETEKLGLPDLLRDIAGRALAKEPSERYREAVVLADELESLLEDRVAPTIVTVAERRDMCAALIEKSRSLLQKNDLDGALEAARQAQALDPTRTTIVNLIDTIDLKLGEATTAVSMPRPELPKKAASDAAGASKPAKPAERLVDRLQRCGAECMREVITFGEGPAASAACLSPRHDLVATSGSDGAIRLWSLASRGRTATLRSDLHQRTGHDAASRAIAFSSDGRTLASGHVDGCVHLWDLRRAAEIPAHLRHEGAVGDVVFSPDGAVLVSGAQDATVKFWDVRAAWSGEARRVLYRQPSSVTALAFAGGATWLVTGHTNPRLPRWASHRGLEPGTSSQIFRSGRKAPDGDA